MDGRAAHPAPRGKTLGGSSSINGHIYNRGQRLDFDTWAQMGNRGWGYADVLPYFRRWSARIGEGDATFRGRDGQPHGDRHRLAPPAVRGVHRRARRGRHPAQSRLQRQRSRRASPTPSAPSCNGRRVSAARAFLHPACSGRTCGSCTHAHAPASFSRASAPSACAIRRAGAAARSTRCGRGAR